MVFDQVNQLPHIVLSDYIHEAFRTLSQVDVIHVDFAEAFDCVDHYLAGSTGLGWIWQSIIVVVLACW